MSDKAAMQSIVVAKAREVGLPPALALALVEQESSFIPTAYRAEPAYYARNIAPNKARWGASPIYGQADRWGSYGLTQVLASTAYGEGYPIELDPAQGGNGWPSLYDPSFSAQLGLRYYVGRWLKYGTFRDGLASYNAGKPSSAQGQKYAGQVLERAGKYLRAGVV